MGIDVFAVFRKLIEGVSLEEWRERETEREREREREIMQNKDNEQKALG